MKKIFIAAALFTLSFATTVVPIDNIFGIKLGDKIATRNDRFLRIDDVNNTIYERINFKGFDKISIKYTPKTKTIYQVYTEKDVSEGCTDELEIINSILEKKYGTMTKNDNLVNAEHMIKQGNKTLISGCRGTSYTKLYIMLTDEELKSNSKKETIEIQADSELEKL